MYKALLMTDFVGEILVLHFIKGPDSWEFTISIRILLHETI